MLPLKVILLLCSYACGENILFLSPFVPRSHEIIFNNVAKVLVDRGHKVTMVSPGSWVIKGVTYRNTETMFDANRSDSFRSAIESIFSGVNFFKRIFFITRMASSVGSEITERCFNNEQILALYKLPPKTYDVVVVNALANFCTAPLAHLQQVPLVMLSPAGLLHHTHASLGNPNLPSISPSPFLEFSDDMSFLERFVNFFAQLLPHMILNFVLFPSVDQQFLNKTGKVIPPVSEIMREASLVLTNTHHSFTYPRPLLPNMVEIGGINCKPAEPLPKEFETFTKSGGKGFIYFSLGSTTPGHFLTKDKTDIIMEVFRKLPYQVIWKYDRPELLENVPSNVMLVAWAPQQDLMGDEAILLFITQGGMLSVQEATYHGVPILGIPMFGDQQSNMKHVLETGIGLTLEWSQVTEQSLSSSIQEIIKNPRYKQNILKRSEIFKDELVKPQDKAAYWIEYILKHDGADFLKSPGRNLWFFQYYLLDVFAFILFWMWICYRWTKSILSKIFFCKIFSRSVVKSKKEN